MRHTAPLFPSYKSMQASDERRRFFIFSVGAHLAASRSSLPGSVPSGVQLKRKWRAVVVGRENV